METLIRECRASACDTETFDKAYSTITSGMDTGTANDMLDTLCDVVSAESERAFRLGFKAAVKLFVEAMA